jgi:hypothetical protein
MTKNICRLLLAALLIGVAHVAHAQSASTPGIKSWPANVTQADAAALAARITLRQQEILAEAQRNGTLKTDSAALLRQLEKAKVEVLGDFEKQRRQLYAGVQLRIDRHHRLARGEPSVEVIDGAEQRIKELKWETKPAAEEASNWRMLEANWNPTHFGGDPHTFSKVATIERIGDQYARFHVPLPKPGLIGGSNIGPIGPKRPKWAVHSWVVFELRSAYVDTLVFKDVRLVESLMATARTP